VVAALVLDKLERDEEQTASASINEEGFVQPEGMLVAAADGSLPTDGLAPEFPAADQWGPRKSKHAADMLARLPLWLRVAVPLVALATLYHYWLPLSTAFTRDLLRLGGGSQLVSSLSFFIHEVPEVMMLLVGIVFAVGVVRTFFSPERTRSLLRGRREFTGNAMAASLGIVTPFCSCSAVPLFIGFVEAGIPMGVTFIAAPMINEVAVVLLFGLFGWKVAAL